MGFRENLKNELAYSGMLIKELAEKSGVSKHALDKYLREDCSVPSAETAVRIAAALGVSVEYLITGNETPRSETTYKESGYANPPKARLPSGQFSHSENCISDIRRDADVAAAAEILSGLEDDDRKMALALVKYFKKRLRVG